jgi:GxxExxY protein
MQAVFRRIGLNCAIECPIKVKYKNVIVDDFRADVFVNEVVIVESKTAKNYNAEEEPQLLN